MNEAKEEQNETEITADKNYCNIIADSLKLKALSVNSSSSSQTEIKAFQSEAL